MGRPYTIEMAERLINGQSELDGPVRRRMGADGSRTSTTQRVGDVAVGIHDNGQQATIGYSVTAAEQGKGYATEAVARW